MFVKKTRVLSSFRCTFYFGYWLVNLPPFVKYHPPRNKAPRVSLNFWPKMIQTLGRLSQWPTFKFLGITRFSRKNKVYKNFYCMVHWLSKLFFFGERCPPFLFWSPLVQQVPTPFTVDPPGGTATHAHGEHALTLALG